jgi:hypothetical protein
MSGRSDVCFTKFLARSDACSIGAAAHGTATEP